MYTGNIYWALTICHTMNTDDTKTNSTQSLSQVSVRWNHCSPPSSHVAPALCRHRKGTGIWVHSSFLPGLTLANRASRRLMLRCICMKWEVAVWGNVIQEVEDLNLSLDLILDVVQVFFFFLSLSSYAQLDDSTKSTAWRLVWIVYFGKSETGKEGMPSQGCPCFGHLNLDHDGTDYTSELFSQGKKEGIFSHWFQLPPGQVMSHGILAPSPFHVCSGQNGWVHFWKHLRWKWQSNQTGNKK